MKMYSVILLFAFLVHFNDLCCQVVPIYDDLGSIREYVNLDTLVLPEHMTKWSEDRTCTFSGYNCWEEKRRNFIVTDEFPGIYSEMYIYHYDSCSNIQRERYFLTNTSFDSVLVEKLVVFDVECEN